MVFLASFLQNPSSLKERKFVVNQLFLYKVTNFVITMPGNLV